MGFFDDILHGIENFFTGLTEPASPPVPSSPIYQPIHFPPISLTPSVPMLSPFNFGFGSSDSSPAFNQGPNGTRSAFPINENVKYSPHEFSNHDFLLAASSKMIPFLKNGEGFRANAYYDTKARPPVWTIGYGFTHIYGRPVRKGDYISLSEANTILQVQAMGYLQSGLKLVKVPLTVNQAAAIGSITYNAGAGNLNRYGNGGNAPFLALLNSGNYQGAANVLPRFITNGGLPGLVNRRNAERKLFLS